MSWFFGIKRTSSPAVPKDPVSGIPGLSPRLSVCTEDLVLYAGGLAETCLSKSGTSHDFGKAGWIVCGLGIERKSTGFSYMTEKSWDTVLTKEKLNARGLNGHYAIVTWRRGTVELYTDPLGLRRVYLMEQAGCVYFSTRLDWLLYFRNENRIDFGNLGSFWSLLASYTHTSFIQNITRLGPGAHAAITDTVTAAHAPWTPSPAPGDPHQCIKLLEDLATMPLKHDNKVMLSLSGGLDCRTILAVLMQYPRDKWNAYCVEESNHPDMRVAQQLSSALDFSLHSVCGGNDDPAYQMTMCKEMALHMEMTFSLFLLNYFHRLPEFYASNFWVVDGGYGEYLRRIYCNYLIHYGKKHLLQKNVPHIANLLRGNKPPIFTADIMDHLWQSAIEHIDLAVSSLPEIRKIGIENWIDLLQIRYRMTNGPANSHSFFDAYIPNFMPFAQPVMLDLILSIPHGKRNNSRINRRIIKEKAPRLMRFPLVRDSVKTPYITARHNYLSKLWTVAARKLGGQYHATFPRQMLNNLKEPIYDRMLSAAVRSYAPYNYPFIKKMVSDFYEKGAAENTGAIYDWLAFDFWREAL